MEHESRFRHELISLIEEPYSWLAGVRGQGSGCSFVPQTWGHDAVDTSWSNTEVWTLLNDSLWVGMG